MNTNIWNEIFDREGRVFEECHPDFHKFTEKMQDSGGKRILDLGCGSGWHLVALRKLGFEVVGLDAAPRGLLLTQDWLSREGLTAEVFLQSMFEAFPFPDNYFDGVLSIQVIHHGILQDVQTAAMELQRVLKPGGLLWVTVPRGHRAAQHDVEIEPGTFIPQQGFEKGLPHHIFTPQAFVALFNKCEVLEQHEDGKNHQAVWARKLI